MGALRRPQPDLERRETAPSPDSNPELRRKSVPRWLVVSSLILYCSVFWVLVWAVGSFGIEMVRTATAGP